MKSISLVDAPKANIKRGKSEAIVIEPKEAFRVVLATTKNMPKHIAAAIGNNTMAPPPAVATPLPPRSRRVSGATCPKVAAPQQITNI